MAQLTETLWERTDTSPLKPFLKGKYYTLNRWPNFGFSEYSPEFVQISAYLSRGYLNRKDILSVVDTDENLLNHFLNTAHLLGILDTCDRPLGVKRDSISTVSLFTQKLKQFFNIS